MDRQQIKKEFQSKQFGKWLTIGAVIGAGVVLLSIAVFEVLDWSLTDLEHTPKEKQAEVRSVIVRNIGLAIAAGIGLGVGFWRAYTAHQQTKPLKLQAKTAARGHFAERFAAAAEHLGHESLAVRLGGLYALEALGRDAEDSGVVSIVKVICSFVRTGPPKKDQKQGGAEDTQPPERSDEDIGGQEKPSITEDIQVALDILTDSETGLRKRLPEGHRLNLKGANLTGADLGLANLTGANLHRANLSEAYLRAAYLSRANLTGANLNGVDLANANLIGAHLGGTNLTKANLWLANLNVANLFAADLRGTNLNGANLDRVELREADLSGADLNVANLTGALLHRADLSGADFRGTNLNGADLLRADLSGADLRGAKNLTQEQLNSAALSDLGKRPLLPEPEGLTPPTCEYERPLWMLHRFT